MCANPWLCKCVHVTARVCDGEGSREEREIETEVEQEQGHPFKNSLQRLCPTFPLYLFHGSTEEEKEGMKDERWAKVLKQIQMWAGEDAVSSHWKYHRNSISLASGVCCRGTEKAASYHTLLQNCGKQPLCQNKQMDNHSHIHSDSFKKTALLTTIQLPSQWLVISVLNWEGSQLTIPSFQTLSTCFRTRLCSVFLWSFAAGSWPTELLLGKPHLSKKRGTK